MRISVLTAGAVALFVSIAVVARPAVADGPDKGSWDPPGGGGDVERIRATAFHLRFREFYYGPVGHASMRK